MGNTELFEDIIAEELLSGALDGTEADYQAKLASVKIGRDLGFSDQELEESLGITLKPEDRA